MRQKEISLNIRPLKDEDDDDHDHHPASVETPMREDAFDLSDEEKIEKIEVCERSVQWPEP